MVPRADVPLTNFTVIAYAHCGLSQVLFRVRIVSPLKAREVDFAVGSLVRLVCLVGKGRELSKNNYSLLPVLVTHSHGALEDTKGYRKDTKRG